MATTLEKANPAVTKKPTGPSGSTAAVPADGSLIRGENGRTIIRHQVVAKIAGLAVREVPGVYRLVPFGPSQQMSSLASAVTRSEMRDLGVQVEVGQEETAVDVRVVATYGIGIPDMADAIRKNVAERIAFMTGLTVVAVNIDVMDLYFGGEDEPRAPAEPRVR